MSKEQWGHGYHAGIETAKKKIKKDVLTGKCFHSFHEDGKINEQGVVLGKIKDGLYLVRYFSWFDGCPTNEKILSVDNMMNFKFYSSDEDMRMAGYEYMNYSSEQIERAESCTSFMKGI